MSDGALLNSVMCVCVQHASEQRLHSLHSLLVFMEQATDELAWLSEKENIELARDWSSPDLQLQELEDYFEVLVDRQLEPAEG